MLNNLENIKRKLRKMTLGKIKNGIKNIWYSILSFVMSIIFWIFSEVILLGNIIMFILAICGVIFIIAGLFNILTCGYTKARFKKEIKIKVQEYNISEDILEEIDREFGKTDEEVAVACGYFTNIRGEIIKLDEIEYIELEARIVEAPELNVVIHLKNGKIRNLTLTEVLIDLVKDIMENKEDIDFGNNFIGKLQQANIEFRFMK